MIGTLHNNKPFCSPDHCDDDDAPKKIITIGPIRGTVVPTPIVALLFLLQSGPFVIRFNRSTRVLVDAFGVDPSASSLLAAVGTMQVLPK